MKTIRCWLTVLFFASCAGSVFGAETNKLIFRCYPVQRAGFDLASDEAQKTIGTGTGSALGAAPETNDYIRFFFEMNGVPFPSGSSIGFDSRMSLLCMRNTEANQDELKRVLDACIDRQSSIELDASYIAFDLAEVEAVSRKNGSAVPTRQQIAELWKSGKGHMLGSYKLITRSGVNAQMQGVDEQIYPTEFVKPETTNAPANASASLPVPSSFETREFGMILNFTPTVQPDGQTIDLVLAPELSDSEPDDIATTLARGENNEESLIVRQPRFHSAKLTTTILMKDGSTFIQGGMATRDGERMIYLFLTTRLIGTDGEPIHPDAEKPVETSAKKK